MCVFIHVYLSTHWSLQLKTSRMFMRTGLRDTWVNSKCRGWVSIGVYKLTKEDITELHTQGRGQPVEAYRGSNCGDMGDSRWLLYTRVCVSYVVFRGAILNKMMFQR